MDSVGSAIAASVAGLQQQAERVSREARRPGGPRDGVRRAQDHAEFRVVETEAVDAVRNAKGNEQEEAREDHRERPTWTGHDADRKPSIDVQG